MTYGIFGLKETDVLKGKEIQEKITNLYVDRFLFNVPASFGGNDFQVQTYDLGGIAFTVYGSLPRKMFRFIGQTKEQIRKKASILEKDLEIKICEVRIRG